MAYRRFPDPENIWEFGVTAEGVTDNDLVKITLENGEVIFVAKRGDPDVDGGEIWKPDERLLPTVLKEVATDGAYWVIEEGSGYCGQSLRLKLVGDLWRNERRFETVWKITSILPARRSLQPQSRELTGELLSLRLRYN